MEHQILGTTLPVLSFTIEPGERLIAVSGELSWMSENIALKTSTQHGGGGGFFGALARVASGGTLFMTEYQAEGGPGLVAFAAKLPGQIVALELSGSDSYLVHRHGFLCSTPNVELSVGFQKTLGSGLFGGNGFLLQKLSGQGQAWVEVGGEIGCYNLAAGQTLLVHPGHVGVVEGTVDFSITTIKGLKNKLFGGDGIFLAKLTGPGRVWLQTLTPMNLAEAVEPYLPQPRGSNS